MLCGPVPLDPIERCRHANQCDLEHTNVNGIRRDCDLPVKPAGARALRTSSKEFMAHGAAAGDPAVGSAPQPAHDTRRIGRRTHLLDDIGLTRAQALREAAKPFWRQ